LSFWGGEGWILFEKCNKVWVIVYRVENFFLSVWQSYIIFDFFVRSQI
jgi:hypothetical protein